MSMAKIAPIAIVNMGIVVNVGVCIGVVGLVG